MQQRILFILFGLLALSPITQAAEPLSQTDVEDQRYCSHKYSIGGWNLDPGRGIQWIRGFMQRKCVLFDGEGGSNGTVDVKVYVRTDNVNVLPQADYLEDDDLVVYATKEFQVSDVTEQDELKAGAWKLVCSGTVTGAYQYRCFAGPNSSVKVVVRNNSNKYSKGGVWHN